MTRTHCFRPLAVICPRDNTRGRNHTGRGTFHETIRLISVTGSSNQPPPGSAGSAGTGATADVDLARLAEISGGDPVLRRGLIDTFVRSGERALADIGSGLPRDDRELVCRAAHTLKGAAANMGAASLQQAAAELEAASQHESVDRLTELARRVAGAFARARSVFEAERRNP